MAISRAPVRNDGDQVVVDQIGGPWDLSAGDRGDDASAAHRALDAELAHRALDGATGHRMSLPVQLASDLPRSVDTVVGRVDLLDPLLELLAAHAAGRGRLEAFPVGVVRGRSDLGWCCPTCWNAPRWRAPISTPACIRRRRRCSPNSWSGSVAFDVAGLRRSYGWRAGRGRRAARSSGRRRGARPGRARRRPAVRPTGDHPAGERRRRSTTDYRAVLPVDAPALASAAALARMGPAARARTRTITRRYAMLLRVRIQCKASGRPGANVITAEVYTEDPRARRPECGVDAIGRYCRSRRPERRARVPADRAVVRQGARGRPVTRAGAVPHPRLGPR